MKERKTHKSWDSLKVFCPWLNIILLSGLRFSWNWNVYSLVSVWYQWIVFKVVYQLSMRILEVMTHNISQPSRKETSWARTRTSWARTLWARASWARTLLISLSSKINDSFTHFTIFIQQYSKVFVLCHKNYFTPSSISF